MSKTVRLTARLSADLHNQIKRAAKLEGKTITDFVVAALQSKAQEVIDESMAVRLTLADQECFAQFLLDPPEGNGALERAFSSRSKLLSAE